uniref:Putative prolyl-4-hydroxylase-alpha ne3 n=1 Tax=Ixodes ricinus TaxID=34613 RepID=A0A0K8R553_IXORI
MDSQLRCRYYTGETGFFKLQPIKLEEFNLKPYVVVLHDLLQDRYLNDMMAFAKPLLEQSKTLCAADKDGPPSVRTAPTNHRGRTDRRSESAGSGLRRTKVKLTP